MFNLKVIEMASRGDLTMSFADVSSLSKRKLQDLFEENSPLLDSLPDEIILKLLAQVPTVHLSKFCSVSQRITQLCHDYSIQERVEPVKTGALLVRAKKYFFTWSILRLLCDITYDSEITINDGTFVGEQKGYKIVKYRRGVISVKYPSGDVNAPELENFIQYGLMDPTYPINYISGIYDRWNPDLEDIEPGPWYVYIPTKQEEQYIVFDRDRFIQWFLANPDFKDQLDDEINEFREVLGI